MGNGKLTPPFYYPQVEVSLAARFRLEHFYVCLDELIDEFRTRA